MTDAPAASPSVQTLTDFIAALGEDHPTPGCGSAGAMALALAAGCARKALLISARHRDGDSVLLEAAERCGAIGHIALAGVAADAEHFADFIQTQGRDAKAVRNLCSDADALLDAAAELTRLLAANAAVIDPALAADAGAAEALAEAARSIIRRNVAELGPL